MTKMKDGKPRVTPAPALGAGTAHATPAPAPDSGATHITPAPAPACGDTKPIGPRKGSRNAKLFSLWQMKWVFLIGAIIIIGAVMSFGLIAFLFLDFSGEAALSMVWMILPMLLVYGVGMHILLMGVRDRMGRLVDGIEAVAGGDLAYRIDTEDAQEYTRVYEDFNRMTEELSRTRAEMDGFVREFAHEFKTPISSIHGFSQLLLEDPNLSEAERREYLEIIDQQSDRLLKLSQNTLLLSKLEAMQVVTDRENYDLAEQLRRCVILFQRETENKRITVEMPEDLAIPWYGSPELMEHAFINLLSNAVKFTPEGGEICISGRREPGEVIISIADSGVGMDAEIASHIFDKYYQADTTSLTKGNGIGLSIVKRIVTLCGGDITVRSAPGKGAIFTMHLPAGT